MPFTTLKGPHVSHMTLAALDHDEVEFNAGVTLNGGDLPTVYYRRAINLGDNTWGAHSFLHSNIDLVPFRCHRVDAEYPVYVPIFGQQ